MRVFTDADRFLLERNRAKSFLSQKRGLTCAYFSNVDEGVEESGTIWHFDFHEECCEESCNTEEVDENINQWHYSNYENVFTYIYRTLPSSR